MNVSFELFLNQEKGGAHQVHLGLTIPESDESQDALYKNPDLEGSLRPKSL